MEIYKDLNTQANKDFENLLNSQLSKIKIEEGKIIDGLVTKITNKFVFLFVEGLKSEPVLDINELKSLNLIDKIKEGSKIAVLLEKIEDKNGDVVVSATKAQKIKGWYELEKAYEKNEPIIGRIVSKCKGGVICEHIDTKSLLFMPGSQISDKPLKDISHLMNEPMKLAIIKLDKIRGNACVSRRQIVTSNKAQDKAKIIAKYKVGDKIKDAIVKGYSSFGCFFGVNDGELDVLVHLQEISWSRINHPDEVFNVGEKHDLLVISVDQKKLQVGCSIKQLSPDPFERISNYEVGKKYKVQIVKLTDYGAFAEIEPGLSSLLHNSETSWTRKNVTAKKLFKVGDKIDCIITEIDTEKRRVAISYRLTKENPYTLFKNKYPIGSLVEGKISSINEYAIYLHIEEFGIDIFVHCHDLVYSGNPEDELKKYKRDDSLKVKVLECKVEDQKIRGGLKQTKVDPLSFFQGKKINDIVTVKVISSDNKGLIVKPEGTDGLNILIKKSEIAINSADSRPSRFVGGERIDSAISSLNLETRKVSLSIKLLEQLQNKEALKMGSNPLSGRQLPFSALSDKLKKDKNESKE